MSIVAVFVLLLLLFFFSITICRNFFFHQNKSLQGFFLTFQCYFIIPRIKTLKKPDARSPY